jgi:outer membrane biosynthesis protein TonB
MKWSLRLWSFTYLLLAGQSADMASQSTAEGTKPDPLPPMTTEQAVPSAEGGIFKVGSGVSAPQVTYKKDPGHSEEARKAHLWGIVVLQLVVGLDGQPHAIKVVRPLGMGLDEIAVETVGTWRFRPGLKQGSPVNVMAMIEVKCMANRPPGFRGG